MRRRWSTWSPSIEHQVLAAHHVVVVVLREMHAQAVGGLGDFAVADVVGQDDEIFVRCRAAGRGRRARRRRAGFSSEWRVAAGAVQQQHGVVDVAGGVAVGRAESEVVELEFGRVSPVPKRKLVSTVTPSTAGQVVACGGATEG